MMTTAISVARQLLLGEMPVVSKSMTAMRSCMGVTFNATNICSSTACRRDEREVATAD
jgi:hypothetical protein